jgi:GNAT superfamily N-acetyltransferase
MSKAALERIADQAWWVGYGARLAASAFSSFLAGARTREWPDLVTSDLADPNAIFNWTFIKRPIATERSAELLARLREFYGAMPRCSVWDPWCTVDLTAFGFESRTVPFMVREPDGRALPPAPPELTIRSCSSVADLEAVGRIVGQAFDPDGTAAARRFAGIDLAGPVRVWLGEVAGKPVACLCGHVGEYATYLDFLATLPECRGRGYGAALAWAGTLYGTLPMAQHAHDKAEAYAAMGYRAIADTRIWSPQGTS